MILVTSGADCVIAWSFAGKGPMGKPPLGIGGGLGRLVNCVAVHPKNPVVAAGFDEGQVIVCALGRQDKIVRLRWPDWDRVATLGWSRDGTRLAVGTEAGAISPFDFVEGTARLMSVTSPCIDVCRFDRQTGFCFGCLRTREEAHSWCEMTDDRRRQILGDVPRHRAKLGSDGPRDQQGGESQDGMECGNAHSTPSYKGAAVGRGDLSACRCPTDPLAPERF